MISKEQERWTTQIKAWLALPETADVEFVTVERLLSEVIKTDAGRTLRAKQMCLSSIMSGLGWGHQRWTPPGHSKRVWGYFRP